MKPLQNAVPVELDYDVSYGEFDYDAILADPGTELWIIRVPKKVCRITSFVYLVLIKESLLPAEREDVREDDHQGPVGGCLEGRPRRRVHHGKELL